ncbi:conserved exported hypothetical protein [Limnobacter sp. 130]|uniref:type II secretion system protein GspD n=1 Tax=Limnobacter sp. 130 TaxID=2653147 RepID=UPI0012EF7AD8|nr:hypothetical protein [Limnobacter sp. 130]VWX33639.1 conserved exported hypothetical protein [Limnobacter sp. 130]
MKTPLNRTLVSTAIAALLCLATAACTGPQIRAEVQADNDNGVRKVDQVNSTLPTNGSFRGSSQYAEEQARQQQNAKVLKRASKSWIGSTFVHVNDDDKLPAVFHETYKMNFADKGRPVDLNMVAARLTQMVGIPVRIQQDVFSAPVSAEPRRGARQLPPVNAPAEAATPPSTPTVTDSVALAPQTTVAAVFMNWDGTLIDFLNNTADKLGLSWEYRDNSIVIMRYTTAMYELASFPNGYEYAMSSGTQGRVRGNEVQSNSNLSVSEKGKINGQASILDVINRMVASVPGSEVIVAEGTGRVMVKTSRDMQTQVRNLIRAENANMLKQVHVQLDIYSVMSKKDDQQGVNWDVFFRSLSQRYGIGVLSPDSLVAPEAGLIALTIPEALQGFIPGQGLPNSPTNQRFGASSAIVQALNEIGDNVQHRPISLVALNRQWARKARLTTTGYLSETKPASSGALGGGTGVPGLTTDEITTGDQFAAMPFILENNTIMLKMGISLSDLTSLLEITTGSGETLQRVQTPNTSSISDQYTIALRPGEVMAITGLSRDVSGFKERKLTEQAPLLAGGSRNLSTMRENFIVLVRAVVL